MSDTSAAYFRVGGTPAGPAPPGAGPVAGGGSRQGVGRIVDSLQRHRVLWLAGAGASVVGLALWQSRGDADTEDERELTDWEIDTRDTDLYNEIQPELEEIADAIDDAHDPPPGPKRPRPPVGRPVRHFHRRANTDTDPEREGIWHSHAGGNKQHGHWWLQGPKGPKPKGPRRRPKPGRPDDGDDGGRGDGDRRRRRRGRRDRDGGGRPAPGPTPPRRR